MLNLHFLDILVDTLEPVPDRCALVEHAAQNLLPEGLHEWAEQFRAAELFEIDLNYERVDFGDLRWNLYFTLGLNSIEHLCDLLAQLREDSARVTEPVSPYLIQNELYDLEFGQLGFDVGVLTEVLLHD